MRRLKTILVVALALVSGLAALPGCAVLAEPQVVVIVLRDDAAPADIAMLHQAIRADSRVMDCIYISLHENPSEEQVAAEGTPTLEPEGDMPWTESRFEITLRSRLSERELQTLMETVQAHEVFRRTVLGASTEVWWRVQ